MTSAAPGDQRVLDLLDRLFRIDRAHQTLLVGIDGCGGSGKSTLASALASAATRKNVAVVAMDDFYRPSDERRESPRHALGDNFDWRRLREQVLVPVARNESAQYQRYDWDSDRLAEWHLIPTGGAVIVEGLYSTRTELRDFYDLTIWVEAAPEVRLARGIARDGKGSQDRWLREWMVEETRYIDAENPAKSADLIVDGCADLDVTATFSELQ
jgi:uridine kinase